MTRLNSFITATAIIPRSWGGSSIETPQRNVRDLPFIFSTGTNPWDGRSSWGFVPSGILVGVGLISADDQAGSPGIVGRTVPGFGPVVRPVSPTGISVRVFDDGTFFSVAANSKLGGKRMQSSGGTCILPRIRTTLGTMNLIMFRYGRRTGIGWLGICRCLLHPAGCLAGRRGAMSRLCRCLSGSDGYRPRNNIVYSISRSPRTNTIRRTPVTSQHRLRTLGISYLRDVSSVVQCEDPASRAEQDMLHAFRCMRIGFRIPVLCFPVSLWLCLYPLR